ncbi:MAG: glycosyltransferase family 2 protein [Flavipsychrobacter sp.]
MVSIIIVNYNTFKITCNCIESIINHTSGIPYEIIVVDNCSTTDNPDDFLIRFPSIILVKSPTNSGFAKGNNLGIEHATGNILLLLNSDTILTENSILKAATYLENNQEIGALSVRLVYPDGKLQHTARKFRSIKNELLDLCRPLLLLLPYKQRASLMLNQYFKGNFNTPCDWVSGAFMMFSATLYKKLPHGKLDERFFMYGEDELWCYQFTQLGYINFYLTNTTVIHIGNASTSPEKQLKLLKIFIDRELQIMLYRKGKVVYYYVFRTIFTAKELLRYYIKVFFAKIFKHRIR